MQGKANVCPCFPPESFWFLVQPDAHHSIVPPYPSTPNSPTWKKSGKLNEFLARKKGLLKFESKGMRKDPKCCWRCGEGQGRVTVTMTQGWRVQTAFSLHDVHSTTNAANAIVLMIHASCPCPIFLLMVHWHVKDPSLAPNTSCSPSLSLLINSPYWRSSFTTCCLLIYFF